MNNSRLPIKKLLLLLSLMALLATIYFNSPLSYSAKSEIINTKTNIFCEDRKIFVVVEKNFGDVFLENNKNVLIKFDDKKEFCSKSIFIFKIPKGNYYVLQESSSGIELLGYTSISEKKLLFWLTSILSLLGFIFSDLIKKSVIDFLYKKLFFNASSLRSFASKIGTCGEYNKDQARKQINDLIDSFPISDKLRSDLTDKMYEEYYYAYLNAKK